MPTSAASSLCHSGTARRGARAGLICLALLLAAACTGGGGSGLGNNSSGGSGGGGGGQVAAPRVYNGSYDFCATASAAAAGPRVFYTDITSGPNSGGETNLGAYLTLFGEGFGASRGTSTVTINGIAVAAYKQWSDTKITIQPGSSVTSGAIVVTVDGHASNSDQSFTVRPGQIYFVSLSGNDGTGIAGDISHPFRHVQATYLRSDFGPGDQIVMRAGANPWTDIGDWDAFFTVDGDKTNPAGDPVVLMAYPGEHVVIQPPSGNDGIKGYHTSGGYTIAGLVFDMQGHGGTPFGMTVIPSGHTMENVRAVNNEFTGMISNSGGSAAMEGRGHNIRYFGNRIYNNGVVNGANGPVGASSKLYHSIYFDNNDCTGTENVEIAYNTISFQGGGRGIQIFNDLSRCAASSVIRNVSVHHNVIHDIALDGILFGDTSKDGMVAYNNVVYRTARPELQTDGTGGGCIRFNDPGLIASVANNTFADCAMDIDADSAALRFDNAATGGISLVNNIFATSGGLGYYTGSPGGWIALSSNNLWDASGAPPTWDANPRAGYPQFMCFNQGDFRLQSPSPAIDNGLSAAGSYVTTDIDGIPRPQGTAIDIGAYEFYP